MRVQASLLAAVMLAGAAAQKPVPSEGEVLVRIETAFGSEIKKAYRIRSAPAK